MMIFGAVGGAVTGVADIFNILILQGLAVPAIITLGLNIWTTNNNALYTAGLGVSNITKVPMKPMVLAGGLVGTATAIWLYYNFVGFLNLLSGMDLSCGRRLRKWLIPRIARSQPCRCKKSSTQNQNILLHNHTLCPIFNKYILSNTDEKGNR